MTFDDLTTYEAYAFPPSMEWRPGWPDHPHEYHDPDSVQVGELVEAGWLDLSDTERWPWPKYDDEQDARIRRKIVNRYWNRGLGILPPGLWRRQFLEVMEEIMPRYVLMYSALSNADLRPGMESEWYKGRNIFSDFPQTQLSGNSDYASTGNDTEWERIRQLDVLETLQRLRDYRDVDVMVLDDIEGLFSCIASVSLNAR